MSTTKSFWFPERYILFIVLFFFFSVALVASSVVQRDPLDAIVDMVDGSRFNYVTWTIKALFNKAVSASLKAEKFMQDEHQVRLVEDYFDEARKVEENEQVFMMLYAQPHQGKIAKKLEVAQNMLEKSKTSLNRLSRFTETVLQNQTERTLLKMGFGIGGQVFPPVLYQVSELPLNLIISPRQQIMTAMTVSLIPGLDTSEKDAIEKEIGASFDFSALIEPVGGVGTYPSMVVRTYHIHWLTETVAHEWTHNYLSLRPLGIRYFKDYAMRTINETTASLSGVEIGRALIASFYPDKILAGYIPLRKISWVPTASEIGWLDFDFRREMHETRVTVDALLAAGKVEEAEAYMEARRQVFWEAGYAIRKINQAYFAFYGSYSDTPVGAAGEDPIGLAVRGLRYSFKRLKPFIDTIQGVRSFSDLMERALAFGIIEKK